MNNYSRKAADLLNAFMVEMQAIISDENYNTGWFDENYGLCQNLRKYIFSILKSPLSAIWVEQTETLLHRSMGSELPFDDSYSDHYLAVAEHRLYENQQRLDFIKNWKPL